MTDKNGRRGAGEGSVYQRASDGRWVAAIDLGWQGGKRRRVVVTAKTKRDALARMREKSREIDAGVLTDSATVEQWVRHWLETVAKQDVRPRVWQTYGSYCSNWIIPQVGKRRLSELRPEHVRGMVSAMRDAGRSEATQHHAWAILRTALEVARKEGRVMRNAADDMQKPPSLGKGSHGKLTLEEARKVLPLLAGFPPWRQWPDADRWGVALLAGLRQSEALGLRWEDVDLDRRLLLISRSAQAVTGQGMVLGDPKSRTSRRAVPIIPALAVMLERTPPERRAGWLWPGRDPQMPRTPSWDAQQWKRLLAAAGVPHRPMHAARATTGSLLMEAGVPTKVVSEILGHSEVQVTESRYLRGDERQYREAMDAMGALVSGAPDPGASPDSDVPSAS